jgi:hypothetical protein
MEISTQQILEQRSDPELKKWLFNQLMQTHQSKIFHVVRRMVHCQQDALDIDSRQEKKRNRCNKSNRHSIFALPLAYEKELENAIARCNDFAHHGNPHCFMR